MGSSKAQKINMAFGVVSGIHENWKNKLQTSQLGVQTSQIAENKAQTDAAVQRAFADRAAMNWKPSEGDRTSARGIGYDYLPTAAGEKPVELPKTAVDSFELLNKDVRAASSEDLGTWRTAENKRVKGDNMVADITKPDMLGNSVKSTIMMSKKSYDRFLARDNALTGASGTDLGTARPTVESTTASPPKVESQNQYDSLPTGSLYIDSRDGKLKRKK